MSEGTAVDWCVADLETDRALGSVTLFSRGGPIGDTAELGYQFFPSARGRGAAKEAARLAVAHALAPAGEGGLGVRRLVAETAADNEASNAVLRSVGFVEFGREHAVDRVAGRRLGRRAPLGAAAARRDGLTRHATGPGRGPRAGRGAPARARAGMPRWTMRRPPAAGRRGRRKDTR